MKYERTGDSNMLFMYAFVRDVAYIAGRRQIDVF